HVGKQPARQMQGEAGDGGTPYVAQIAQPTHRPHGIEQAAEPHIDIALVLFEEEAAEAFPWTPHALPQLPSATPRGLAAKVPGSRCAPAEAERIEGKGCDLDVRVVLDETIQSDLDLAKRTIHPRGNTCLATPKSGAKKIVFPSRLSTDAFDINLENPPFLFSAALRGWQLRILIP